ncbi:MAG: class I SAM-dependent methyltransferase, partial [Pirellulales bacterium]
MQSAQFHLHAAIEERHWWFVARRRIMRELIGQVLRPSPKTMVIDVGCGTGGNIASLADDYACVGIDTSDEAIRFAQQRFPKVRFLCGRAPADLGDFKGQAKLLMLMDVLEHVADDAALLADLVHWATPGTYFLLTVPADPSLWSAHDESFGHHRRYDLDRFRQAWANLPVTTLLASYFNTRLYPLVKLARMISRWRGHAAGK